MKRSNPLMQCRVTIDGRIPAEIGLGASELKQAAERFAYMSSKRIGVPFREVSVILQDDAASDIAHNSVMGVEGATDVITQGFDAMPGEEPGVYGELYVNCDRAISAAPRRRGWSPAKELLLYVAHGMDHLSGADDHSIEEYARMRRRELGWIAYIERDAAKEKGSAMTRDELASMIDHTFLKPAGEQDAIERLCSEAEKYRFACAMVNPCEVSKAAGLLQGSSVRIGTVVGFPLGASTIKTKIYEAVLAVEDGALDIDLVVNMRQLKAAVSDKAVRSELQEDLSNFNDAVKERDQGVCTKLILECCYLTDEEKVLGCRLAKAAGFDFVKTSTGFGTGGATVHDVKLMRRTVGKKMGVKAAGGIRTLDDALKFIDAGASRLGCSAGVSIIEELA